MIDLESPGDAAQRVRSENIHADLITPSDNLEPGIPHPDSLVALVPKFHLGTRDWKCCPSPTIREAELRAPQHDLITCPSR